MKRTLLFLFLLISFAGFSQNLLDNQWQFRTGDSLQWKYLSYNSSQWVTVKSGKIWEEQGFNNYDGFAWYRKSIVISEELKKNSERYNGMTLYLGNIDDADQIFFNGKLVGETGKMPPHYEGAYDKIRKIHIATKDIRWGSENLIAVRVFDGGGGGGLICKDIMLKVGGFESTVQIDPQFARENHLFLNDETPAFKLNIENSSNYNINGELKYVIVTDFKDTLFKVTKSVKISKHTTDVISIDNGKLAPGIYTITATLKNELFELSKSSNFGVNPEKIVSPTDRALDFDNFWMRAKHELAAVEPQFKMIHNDTLSTDKRDVYLVEMRSLGNVLVRGWYVRPKAKGKCPVILHVQGYGSNPNMTVDYKDDDMAQFLLSIRGTGVSRDNVDPGFPGYILNSIKDREQYIYRGAYMDCVRAVDFLCGREDIDSRYIVVEGGSQGGALSIATAALNNDRIALCIPAVPFLSDFRDYFKIAKWPANEFVEFQKQNTSVSWENIYENLSYFDIKNLAGWVRCPVYMSVGLKDTTCPPHINFAAYNQLNVPKSYVVYPESGHGLPYNYSIVKYEWMKQKLAELKK